MTKEQMRLEKAICQLRYEYDAALKLCKTSPYFRHIDPLEYALFETQNHYRYEKNKE